MLTHGLSESHAPARVVILGANGFVPQALQQRLTQNQWPFLALGSQSLDLTDLTSGTKLAAILRPNDALVMTAALTPEKGRDVATLIRNLRMVETVGAALAIQPIAHLVYFSSDAVYDARESVISEDTATAPADLYGIMHLAREVALTPIAAKGAVPFCVLRPCAIYGRGDTHNSYGPNRFVRTATKEGVIRLFGAGEETRDHVSIDNVVAATLRVLERRSTGTVNLVSGQSLSFGDVARLIVSQAGKPVTIESLPRAGPVDAPLLHHPCVAKRFSGSLHPTSARRLGRPAAPRFRLSRMNPLRRKIVAGVIVLREDGAALLQHRDDIPTINDPGLWVVPGGHVELGETAMTGAVREVEEETCYRCAHAKPLAQFTGAQLGYTGDFDMIFFWDTYDGVQRIECREGQAAAFVPRAQAAELPSRDYLTRVWDLALAARARVLIQS